jgi:hypothetical protein
MKEHEFPNWNAAYSFNNHSLLLRVVDGNLPGTSQPEWHEDPNGLTSPGAERTEAEKLAL